MMQSTKVIVAAVLFAAFPGHLAAQWDAGLPGEDRASLTLGAGLFSTLTDYPDGTAFNSTTTLGVSAKAWILPSFGVHASYLRFSTDADDTPLTPPSFYEPKVMALSAGPIVRRPFEGGGFAVAPYLGASVGVKTYTWRLPNPRESSSAFAWDVLGGVELRMASRPQFGLTAEVRNLRSKYPWHGFQENPLALSEVVGTVGLSLHR